MLNNITRETFVTFGFAIHNLNKYLISQNNSNSMSLISVVSFFVIFACFTSKINTFEASQTQYEFLFEGQLKVTWILERQEDLHFLTCTQKCQKNFECIGVALSPVKENETGYKRTCYLLKYVDTSEQYCSKEDCDEKFVEVYEVSLSFHILTLFFPFF